jgi:hypothetical protein
VTGSPIFVDTAPPERPGFATVGWAGWFTWSRQFRDFLADSVEWLDRLPEPNLRKIDGLGEYGSTFHLAVEPPRELTDFALSLCRIKQPAGVMLFTRLLSEPLDGRLLRRVFALLRTSIANILGDERYSLYAPLGTTGMRAGDFGLHADLYMPEILFNVFENVPGDGSGASEFLPVRTLLGLTDEIDAVPKRARARLKACFRDARRADRFNELYGLLHYTERPWAKSLRAAMSDGRRSILLGAGEGYLLHDRTWLHGRTAPTGGVPVSRLHRLVFNTLALQRKIKVSLRAARP